MGEWCELCKRAKDETCARCPFLNEENERLAEVVRELNDAIVKQVCADLKSPDAILKQVLKDMKNPKFPKAAAGYMYFDSEHAIKQRGEQNGKH